jgi:hypothetical protein
MKSEDQTSEGMMKTSHASSSSSVASSIMVDLDVLENPNDDDNHQKQKNQQTTNWVVDQRELSYTFSSNMFFILASTMYLVLSVYDFQWEAMVETLPDAVVNAEDDAVWEEYGIADDYVFETPRSQVMVSQYMIIYFSASVAFVILGILDFFKYRMHFVGIFFVLAGIFGVLAALFVEKDEDLSATFDLISSCLFFTEAIQMFVERPHHNTYKFWLRTADIFFCTGATLDVITASLGKFKEYNLPLSSVDVFTSCLWLICALIYTIVMVCLYKRGHYRIYNGTISIQHHSASGTDHKKKNNKGKDNDHGADDLESGSTTNDDAASASVQSFTPWIITTAAEGDGEMDELEISPRLLDASIPTSDQ